MPSNFMTQHRLRLRVITPVHIGGGEDATLGRNQYFINNNKKELYIIDENKLSQVLSRKNKLELFAKWVSENAGSLQMEQIFDRFRFTLQEQKEIIAYTLDIKDLGTTRINAFRGFIKDAFGNPYIPGSSIKGSIRTAMLTALLLERPEDFQEERRQVFSFLAKLRNPSRRRSQNESSINAKNIEQQAFEILEGYETGPLKSIMRGIRISDAVPVKRSSLMIGQKKDLIFAASQQRSTIKRLPIFREYLRPGTTCEFVLTFDHCFLSESGLHNLSTLFSQLEKQRQWLLNSDDSPYVLYEKNSGVNYNLDLLRREKRPLLCLGGGVGFQQKTVVYPLGGGFSRLVADVARLLDQRYSLHRHSAKDILAAPRALKLVEYKGQHYLPGWCVIEEVI